MFVGGRWLVVDYILFFVLYSIWVVVVLVFVAVVVHGVCFGGP